MAKRSGHEAVSSEPPSGPERQRETEGEGEDLHESVSGTAESHPEETVGDMVAEGFEGKGKAGEIESVIGFDPTHALVEGMASSQFIITDELASLKEVHPEEYGPETVCGRDDRVQVSVTTGIPWRWICQLIITMANGQQSRCTGWFIGPKAVMTAGHCVYSKGNGGWARQIEVIPACNGAVRPFGSQVGTSFRSVKGWTDNSDPNYDYGAIILPNGNLGNTVGWFGFASLSDASLKNLLANNSGYPADKPFGTQWFNAGRVTNVTARKFYYMLDTFGGQSGSPTWRFLNGQRHAVGVHAYGGCPNSSTRIVQAVFNNMLAWRNL